MTEEEAKTKWCPMVRFFAFSDPDIDNEAFTNRDDEHAPQNVNCIASACMAWRTRWMTGLTGRDRDGYCGLAGLPPL